jgi:cell division cycle protein 20 (cofactor of APC complex)
MIPSRSGLTAESTNALFSEESLESRVLSFKNKAPVSEVARAMDVMYSSNKVGADVPRSSIRASRHISSKPARVLDAPDIVDDYYLNLVSWSSKNVFAVALHGTVYLWNAKSGTTEELMTLSDDTDYVCSLNWVPGGTHLAVGTASAATQLWDAGSAKLVRTMDGHSDRVSSLSWNKHILSSGSKDTTIVHHDVRASGHHVGTLAGHAQEVCGLAWSPDGSQLASGGNDNRLCIWDASVSGTRAGAVQEPKFTCTDHCAAVKALAWSPHERNLVASGGGTADRCIKFTNSLTGSTLNSIDTGSQVTSLLWSPHEKEILSGHGFTKNELCLWSYPAMAKTKELTGHTGRVLSMAMSPTGQVCSASADETLRFWDVFGDAPEAKKAKATAAAGSFNSMKIR